MNARAVMERALAAGLELSADGDVLVVRPKSKLTDDMRAALRQVKPELLVMLYRRFKLSAADADRCHAGGWSNREIAAFTARTIMFVRRGISATDADDLAERLLLRDREHDERRSCIECEHHTHSHCGNHKAAGLASAEIGCELATTLQRCAGFEPMSKGQEKTKKGPR